MSFTDFNEVLPGLYIGSNPDPEDPFTLWATVVVSLTPDTSARGVQAGMNRSALVVARVLMQRGMGAEEAIDLVRERRCGALGDEYAAWLLANPIAHAEKRAVLR
jgi:hypothetical protein